MLENIKNIFKNIVSDTETKKVEDNTKNVVSKPKLKKKTPKELANERGEPYISVMSVELDPDNVGNGAFELDWNDIFVAKLVRAGYKGQNDQQIVDQWFQTICRNIVMENFEQDQADPDRRILSRKKIDDSRTEFS